LRFPGGHRPIGRENAPVFRDAEKFADAARNLVPDGLFCEWGRWTVVLGKGECRIHADS